MNVGTDPLLRPSLRRSHCRSFERRSISLRTSAPPVSCWGGVYVAKGMPDRAVEELERAQGLMGPRPDVMTPTPTSSPGLDAGARRLRRSTNCGASRSRGSPRPFASPSCTSASERRIERSNGFRRRSRRGTGRWACSRSSRRSMACARIRALLRCSSALASHDKRRLVETFAQLPAVGAGPSKNTGLRCERDRHAHFLI